MCRNNILNSSFFYLPPVMHIVVKLVESLHLCALIEQINEQHIIKYQTAQCLCSLPFNIKSCSRIHLQNCNLDFLFSLTRVIKKHCFFLSFGWISKQCIRNVCNNRLPYGGICKICNTYFQCVLLHSQFAGWEQAACFLTL